MYNSESWTFSEKHKSIISPMEMRYLNELKVKYEMIYLDRNLSWRLHVMNVEEELN